MGVQGVTQEKSGYSKQKNQIQTPETDPFPARMSQLKEAAETPDINGPWFFKMWTSQLPGSLGQGPEEPQELQQSSEVGLKDLQGLADSDFPASSRASSSRIALVEADMLCDISFPLEDVE